MNASFSILAAIFLWSSLGVVVRLSGVPVQRLIFYSFSVAVCTQAVLVSRNPYRSELSNLRRMKQPVILGLIGLCNHLAFYYAFQRTTIANAILTHYTAPVIVAFLSPLFLGERMTRSVVIAIVAASVGLIIMMNGFTVTGDHFHGILAGLASGFTYAGIVILGRVFTQTISPLVLTFVSNSVIVLLLLPFAGPVPLSSLWAILVMGVVHSTIAPLLYYHGLRRVTANRTAVLGYLEPVCAILFSYLILREVPGENSLIGGALILVSGYLTLREREA